MKRQLAILFIHLQLTVTKTNRVINKTVTHSGAYAPTWSSNSPERASHPTLLQTDRSLSALTAAQNRLQFVWEPCRILLVSLDSRLLVSGSRHQTPRHETRCRWSSSLCRLGGQTALPRRLELPRCCGDSPSSDYDWQKEGHLCPNSRRQGFTQGVVPPRMLTKGSRALCFRYDTVSAVRCGVPPEMFSTEWVVGC